MSCLDVMYHQSYGAHYLPATAYKATHYNHHHQQQQKKLSIYNKIPECMEQQQQERGGRGRGLLSRDLGLRQSPMTAGAESGHRSSSDSELKDGSQPAEAEYLSSRCVLFTYFQGNIGDVVDEHFSRALSQSSSFSSEKPITVTQPTTSPTAGLWKDGGSLSNSQGSPTWNSAYPSQASPCLPSVSVSVHPDFSSSPVSFNHPDGGLWAGHVLSQTSFPPAASLPDSWTYSLNPQSTSGYSNVHDVYHPHTQPYPHIHTRRHHPMLHTYPAHSPALDPRFSPLLLPGVRTQNSAVSSSGSPLHSEGMKTKMDPSSTSPVSWTPSPIHGSMETYDSALDQTKAKASVWF